MRSMATALILLLALVLTAAGQTRAKAPKQSAPKATFTKAEEILHWIQDYRLEPEPLLLPDAVRSMQRLGLIGDTDTSGVYVGFVAGVLGDNPRRAEEMIGKMFPMPPEDQGLIVRAIAYSGLPDWKDLMGKVVERMPARRVLIDGYLQGKSKGLAEMPLDSGPAAIDTLWGYYFATGSYAPILRIISSLEWGNEKSDVNKLTIASMAKWTLATNASRDRTLLNFCRGELSHQPKPIVASLKEVVEAADTFETGKIRKDALAAIEELKRRGPAKDTTWAWASTATSTVIALGCVVAGATGHVELGLPCIVTGALSSGAAKLLGGQ